MDSQPHRDAYTWGMLCHLSALVGYFVPFGNIIAPLIIWLIKRDNDPFVNDQGKEAVNFQISITIYTAIASILILILIGIPAIIALAIMNIVFIIIATVKSSNGEAYRYPMTIRFLK
jgi:uncharacterized Tic20 family protein